VKRLVVLGIVGSPRRDGLTGQIVGRALEGVEEAGVEAETLQLSDCRITPCRDCYPRLACWDEKRCVDEDDFPAVSAKMDAAQGIVLGSPVYYGDVTCATRNLLWKKARHPGRPLEGVPGLGIAVAGGSGNGMVSALRPIYHFFRILQLRGMDPIPVTRFNFRPACEEAFQAGRRMAELVERGERPVGARRLAAFADLPYLRFDYVEERLLLARLLVEGITREREATAAAGRAREAWKQAEGLVARGEREAAIPLINEAYRAGISVWEGPRGERPGRARVR